MITQLLYQDRVARSLQPTAPTRLRVLVNLCILTLFALCPIELQAQPQLAGVVKPINITYGSRSIADSDVQWTWRFQHQGSKFLQLHFSKVSNQSKSPFVVTIRDFSYKAIESYSSRDFARSPEFWTGLILGDSVVVEVTAPTKLDGLKFELTDVAYQAEGGRVLSISGVDQRKPLYELKDLPQLQLNSKPVARISYWKNDKIWYCTGFLIDDQKLITNHHCISDLSSCKSATVWFGYEEINEGVFSSDVQQTRCVQVQKTSSLLDYSILELPIEFSSSNKWGHLEMPSQARTAIRNLPLYLIQHPAGEAKQISIQDCLVTTDVTAGLGIEKTDFGHSCDTMTGSSGSPVFDSSHHLVGLHHLGMCKSGRWEKENRAVHLNLIASDLKNSTSSHQLRNDECLE